MNRIVIFLKSQMRGPELDNLHGALQLLLDREIVCAGGDAEYRTLLAGLADDRAARLYGAVTERLVCLFQEYRHIDKSGEVDAATAEALNAFLIELGELAEAFPMDAKEFKVVGVVRFSDNSPAAGMQVSVFCPGLRSENLLGSGRTDADGRYAVCYRPATVDLAVKVFDADVLLATSPILFHAPALATIDVTIGSDKRQPPSQFEKICRSLAPLLAPVGLGELEEGARNKDLSYLSGVTGMDKTALARFVLAHRLPEPAFAPEFWFALLGGSFFRYSERQDLAENLAAVRRALPSLDSATVRQTVVNGIGTNDIAEKFRTSVDAWVEAFEGFAARALISDTEAPNLLKSSLDDAGVADAKIQETIARLYNEHKTFPRAFIAALQKEPSLTKSEVDDLATSFHLSDLTRGDFSVVKMIKDEFGVRTPAQIPSLAKRSKDEWVQLVKTGQAAGAIVLPIDLMALPDQKKLPDAEVYGQMLERQFREAYPTAAFAGGLGRAMTAGATPGLRHAGTLNKLVDQHPDFDLLTTPVDQFLRQHAAATIGEAANDDGFRLELKAVQRVFKLAPNFDASTALLADGVHSAHQVYRMGKTQFVGRYGAKSGFNVQSAEIAWNRAADTSAAVVTILADLKALDGEGLPMALKSGNDAVSAFPDWQNLFGGSDLCSCEDCRSVLSPAAYFADLLMFLKGRFAVTNPDTVKDVLFRRRPDLGYLELNCDNALTPLPYVDVVCEVLEDVVAGGENDIELIGLTAIPADANAAQTSVAAALTTAAIDAGKEFSLRQVDVADPDRWVVHGDAATYLLKKKNTANFFAQILRNTKASAEELRAYPQYVNEKAYYRLNTAAYPLSLPFDLFGEEVRAAVKSCNLQRWDLMRTLQGPNAPNNPTDGEIAAEYFGISVAAPDPANPNPPIPPVDEKNLILVEAATEGGQQIVWGEVGNAGWLAAVANVKTFLQKTRLEYEDLLVLLDLKFLNSTGDIAVKHLNDTCDLAAKTIEVLDAPKLDRIHRFLRMWRKLDGWHPWELDLAIRHPAIGKGKIDEPFLINLFYLSEIRKRLGAKATVEQVCALFGNPATLSGNLNTETRFTAPFKPRADGLYQRLFLNRKLIHPIDPAFVLDAGTGDVPAGTTIHAHMAVVQAALGIRQADLDLYLEITKLSDLTLANLSILWRHSWLAKSLKLKADAWCLVLKLLAQNVSSFGDPQSTFKFLDRVDGLLKTGFTADQLNWLLAADKTAKAAAKEADVSRFLLALRKQLQAIQFDNSPAKYPFLTVTPPTDHGSLATLVTSLLQQLGRDETDTQFVIDSLGDTVSQQAVVAGLGAPVFPPAIEQAGRVHYDAAANVLRFVGVMTDAEKSALLALSALPAYQQAIEDFHAAPRLAFKFFTPVFTAPLVNLPAGVNFAALADTALARKVSYNPEKRLLQFTGILFPAGKAALEALSADPDYRAAVASIAAQPQSVAAPDPRIWLEVGDLNYPVQDPSDPTKDNLAQNLATAAISALGYLSQSLSETAVVAAVTAQLGLTEALTRAVLDYALLPDTLLAHLSGDFAGTSAAVDPATLPATFDGWLWAMRVAAIWKKWKITIEDWNALTALSAGAHLIDFLKLPLNGTAPIADADAFSRMGLLLRLRDAFPEPGLTLLQLLVNLDAGRYADSAALASDAARVNDDWSAADIQTLVDSLNLTFPQDWLLAESWQRLARAFFFLNTLNAGAGVVKRFAAPPMNRDDAKILKQLLSSKFGAETWLDLSGQIQDRLRERKRDALDAYILTQPMPADAPSGKWENTGDLYAYYLLDVEMCACMLTSRLVQGSGSIQLFVQRCFMGVEPGVAVKIHGDDGDSAWKWWTWMSKYRVWEANRKVFLWPENWIEPELRKGNSEIFVALQKELLQNDATSDTAQTAFANYLEKLDGVAQLEVAAFYHEDDADETFIHVFGRTKGAEPHVYYYRLFDYREWTPWQKVDLDIQGDFLIPAVLGKRLFLFWPIFTEVEDEAANSSISVPNPGDPNIPMQKPAKKLRVQIAVSEYRQQKWTAKRVSRDYIDSPASYQFAMRKDYLRFFLDDRSEIDGRAGIKFDGYILSRTQAGQDYRIYMNGAFEIGGCHGVPEIGSFPDTFVQIIRPTTQSVGDDTAFLKWFEAGPRKDAPANSLTFEIANAGQVMPSGYPSILMQTPWRFQMTPAWNLSYMDKFWLDMIQMASSIHWAAGQSVIPAGSWLPWFYNDKKRTFFVLPALINLPPPKPTAPGAEPGTVAGAAASPTWLYYPQLKHNFRTLEKFFEGIVQAWAWQTPLSSLPAAEQATASNFLHSQFPQEPPPPYTDKQAADLAARWMMRFFHYYLSYLSLLLFQYRQFDFRMFYHPLVCDFARLVNNPLKGIDALMTRETQLQQTDFSFKQSYQPTVWVIDPASTDRYPKEDVDFTPDGAYSPYNWELFFHVPLAIANSLSQNQKFAEARDWYHYIFNPVGVESTAPGGSAMSKYWITKPFYQTTDAQYVQQRIDNILAMLAGDTTVPGYTPELKTAIESQVLDWRTHPFEPHRIASYRTVAYQKTVVMKYLDNLIAWGDFLFGQDSMESINEATQLYIMASEILGPKPKSIPPRAKPPLETFNELEQHFDAFSNALVQVENLVPPSQGNAPSGVDPAPLPMLYFCVPHNEKLLSYWDTVADRLYKIRHCMNIEGVVRQLALFEPPIDPGALVKAVAGGMDIGSALADLNAPLPFYRFNTLMQKANEVCADVRALGAALLTALEKKDAEALALLRQTQELRVLDAVKAVREKQLDEAKQNLESAKRMRLVTEERRNYYRDIQQLSKQENLYLRKMSESHSFTESAQGTKLGASVISLLPAIDLGISGFGATPVAKAKFGGLELGQAASLAAEVLSAMAQTASDDAQMASAKGGYDRRWEDWKLQERIANKDLDQIDSQLAAAELRITIAQQELDNQNLQIDNSKETDAFMRSKYTNLDLYDWQIGEISAVYFKSYKLAYSLSKRAERCFRFELGVQNSSYISFGYWDSLKKGLLAAEQLQYDLRRLETAYIEQNRREFELTKHVSLALLDPLALVKLRETGRCFVNLPEELFDLDYPGHYFRRIKSVSLTLPCVVGPYTTASCTLRLLKNSVRIATTGDYPRATDDQGLPADDDRFIENNIPFKAIATSSAQNDSGVFELNFHDERYLPFEGAGAISAWSLELFSDLPSNNPDFGKPLRQFDYSTIADAVLHIKYTAREDAGPFRNGAVTHLRAFFAEDGSSNSTRMFDLRREFPSQWERFLKPANPADPNVFAFNMSPDLFFARDSGKTLKINSIRLLARCSNPGGYDVVMTPPAPDPFDDATTKLTLAPLDQYGGLHSQHKFVTALGVTVDPAAPVEWKLQMTGPNGNLQPDPASGGMEVAEMFLVLGYQWE